MNHIIFYIYTIYPLWGGKHLEKERKAIHSTPLDRIKSGTPHILNHLICDQHEILPISVAAMDQQLFFVSSFWNPAPCMFVYIQPSVWFDIPFPVLTWWTHVQFHSDCPTVNSDQWKWMWYFVLLFQINSESYYDARMVSSTGDGTQVNRWDSDDHFDV